MTARARLRAVRRRFDDPLLFACLKLLLPLLAHLPLNLALRIARAMGGLVYRFNRRDRLRAETQLARAFACSPLEAREMAKEVFARLGEGVIELLQLPRRDPGLRTSVEVEGLAHLEQALQGGKGALWLTGHVGNWELMAMKTCMMGYPLHIVTRRLRYPRLDALLSDFRRGYGAVALARGETASLESLREVIARGALLGLLVDQDLKVPGMMVSFFGQPAHTASGAALLALESGIPVVTGFIERQGVGHYVVKIEPLPPGPEGDMQSRVYDLLARVNARIEAVVRRDPPAWPWFHERWRSTSREWRHAGAPRGARGRGTREQEEG